MILKASQCFAVLLCAGACQAAPWTVCDLTILVNAVSDEGVRASVEKTAPSNAASCAALGAEVLFLPERPDYQTHIPRKQWPKKHQRVALRFRTLSGFCKNDGDGSMPCAINHWSILENR